MMQIFSSIAYTFPQRFLPSSMRKLSHLQIDVYPWSAMSALTRKSTPLCCSNQDLIRFHRTNPNNPVPIYDITTTFDKPTVPVKFPLGNPDLPLSVISIDHLPSLLPRESSEMFSQALLPSLLQLNDRAVSRVWKQAEDFFKHHVTTLPSQ
jgi:hypothetical protein